MFFVQNWPRSKGGKDGKRRKRRTETFSLYIYKVLKFHCYGQKLFN